MSMEKKPGTAESVRRNSGMEALKIIAIFLTILSHVMQTLDAYNHQYVVDLTVASADWRIWTLMFFRSFGAWGNTIFFSCSAWFLLDSDRYSRKKWLFMVLEIWVVSVLFLAVMLIVRHGEITFREILESLTPTTHSTNWYLTCYLLFYPIHPFLNQLIRNWNRKQLFRISLVMFVLYYCIGFAGGSLFQSKEIILWIAIYFVMAYLKRYQQNIIQNRRLNERLLLISMFAYAALIVFWNLMGIKHPYFQNNMIRFESLQNPFWLLCALCMVNLAQSSRKRNRIVNKISGLTLLIYIIHENLLLRTYIRPAVMDSLYESFGYDSIVLWVLLLTFLIFILSAAVSALFKAAAEKPIRSVSDRLYASIRRRYLQFEDKVLKKQKS